MAAFLKNHFHQNKEMIFLGIIIRQCGFFRATENGFYLRIPFGLGAPDMRAENRQNIRPKAAMPKTPRQINVFFV